MEPPRDLPSFLGWLRRMTEAFWDTIPEPRLADFEQRGVGGSAWMPNTRWHAFSDSEVAQLEARYGLPLPDDYRLFLPPSGHLNRGCSRRDSKADPASPGKSHRSLTGTVTRQSARHWSFRSKACSSMSRMAFGLMPRDLGRTPPRIASALSVPM